jgi:hypothetical protein
MGRATAAAEPRGLCAARFADGVLELTLPKREPAKRRQIPVEQGDRPCRGRWRRGLGLGGGPRYNGPLPRPRTDP